MPAKPGWAHGGAANRYPAHPEPDGGSPTAGTHGHGGTHEFVAFGGGWADIRAQQTAGQPAQILHERHVARNEYGCNGWPKEKYGHEKLIWPRWPCAVGASHEKSCVMRCLACHSNHNLRVSGTYARF
jgi:hypothetical protein